MKKLGKITNILAMTSFVLAFIQRFAQSCTFDEYINRIRLKIPFHRTAYTRLQTSICTFLVHHSSLLHSRYQTILSSFLIFLKRVV